MSDCHAIVKHDTAVKVPCNEYSQSMTVCQCQRQGCSCHQYTSLRANPCNCN